jgi:hypothetical protein
VEVWVNLTPTYLSKDISTARDDERLLKNSPQVAMSSIKSGQRDFNREVSVTIS